MCWKGKVVAQPKQWMGLYHDILGHLYQGGKFYGERAGIRRIVEKKQGIAHSSDNNARECCKCGEDFCPENVWLIIPECHGYNPYG